MAIQNWAGNVLFNESAIVYPRTMEELQHLVRENDKVKVRGTAHSFNYIADTHALALSLQDLPQEIVIDADLMQARVPAGIKYGDLAKHLHQKGFALNNLASLPHISVAGTVMTGTHGSGSKNQSLADQVVAFEMVLADGALRTFARTSHPVEFDGMVVALGALGIVTHLTLKIEPAFSVNQWVYTDMARENFYDHYEELLDLGYSVSFFIVWGRSGLGDLWVKSKDSAGFVLPDALYGANKQTEKRHPIAGIDPIHCTEQFGESGPWFERLPHFKFDFQPSAGAELQAEFFIGRADAARALRALEQISAQIEEVAMVTEVRAIAGTSLWLAGAHERETIAIHFTLRQDERVPQLLAEIEHLLAPFTARPHWGKLFTHTNLQALYPKYNEFKALLKKYDPAGKFTNNFIETHFAD